MKIKVIEKTVMEIDYTYKNKFILLDLNKCLDYILENEIQKLLKIKKRDNGLFRKLPNEIMENIYSFIDFQTLSQLTSVCHLFNNIISEYINNNIKYCFIFKIYGGDIYKNCYMMIECSECINMKNKYIIQKDIYRKIMFDCNNCIFKEINNDPIYIKKVEIRYIFYQQVKINIHLLMKHKKYIFNIYKKHKINTSKILIINNDENNIFLEDILRIILTNSYGDIEIYLAGILNKGLNIINPNLTSLLITDNLLTLKLNLRNIKTLQIYNSINVNRYSYKLFLDYICNFSLKLINITIENNILDIFNKIDFQNKYINKYIKVKYYNN